MTTVMMPGSYDPITLGHYKLIEQAAHTFDRVYVVVCVNPDKKYLFSVDERIALIRAAVKDIRNITVASYDGLVVDYVRDYKIDFILKGLRNATDFMYEAEMAVWNAEHGAKTYFTLPAVGTEKISSTVVRQCLAEGKSIKKLVAPNTFELISKYFEAKK